MKLRLILATSWLLVGPATAQNNNGNTYNPNVINSPGPSGVGRTDISPSNPSVDSSSRGYKGITGTSERTEGRFNDPEPPSSDDAPISAPAR